MSGWIFSGRHAKNSAPLLLVVSGMPEIQSAALHLYFGQLDNAAPRVRNANAIETSNPEITTSPSGGKLA